MDTPSEHIFKPTSKPPIKQFRRNFTPRVPASAPMNNDERFVLDQPILVFYKPRDRFGRPYFDQVKLFTVTDTEEEFVDFFNSFMRTQNIDPSGLTHPSEIYNQVVNNTFAGGNQNRANDFYHRNFSFRFPQVDDVDPEDHTPALSLPTTADRLRGPYELQTHGRRIRDGEGVLGGTITSQAAPEKDSLRFTYKNLQPEATGTADQPWRILVQFPLPIYTMREAIQHMTVLTQGVFGIKFMNRENLVFDYVHQLLSTMGITIGRNQEVLSRVGICGFKNNSTYPLFYPRDAPFERYSCLLYTSPSPRDRTRSRMPSSA